jgi:pantothenate kinase
MTPLDAVTLAAALAAQPLVVDDVPLPIAPDAAEIEAVYLPLAEHIRDRARDRRIVVGISGLPGSGKTITARVLVRILDLLGEQPAFVGLDGFHLPNAVLYARTFIDEEGRTLSLWHRKGRPDTFDAARFKALLTELRRSSAPVAFPAYSRALHDSVEGAIVVAPKQRIVIAEGNFLFYEQDDWKGLTDLFDLRVFVDTPMEACAENLRARHTRGGRDPADVEYHMRVVDLANMPLILPTRARAHAIIKKADGQRVVALLWQTPGDADENSGIISFRRQP